MKMNDSVGKLKRVGIKTKELLESKELRTVGDLIDYYPSRYEEFGDIVGGAEATHGKVSAVLLTIMGRGKMIRTGARVLTHFNAGDETGMMRLTFFNMPYIGKNMPPGTKRVFYGEVKKTGRGALYMEQPRVFTAEEYEKMAGSLQPVYPLFAGMNNKQMTALIRQVLDEIDSMEGMEDEMPREDRLRLGLCEKREAIYNIHYPKDKQHLIAARNRLIFDEFFMFILGIRKQKAENDLLKNVRPMNKYSLPYDLLDKLPYSLTDAQLRAYKDIERDLTGEFVMNRLLQGDVGSGKTIVAFLGLLLTIANSKQGALMAPTEVLATQHYESFCKMKEEYDLPIHPVLLTGSVKGKDRKRVYEMIACGEADLIVGTHALIQESVEYSDLGFVVTDEQHRFGVRQRESLAGKGINIPVLVMSATPIPRTLAIILYGDLQVSVLDEMPKGRLPIKNTALPISDRPRVYKFIMGQLQQGRQAYIICPEVEEGEMSDLENVTDYTEKIRSIFPSNVRIDMLHGKMKPQDKNDVMDRFKDHSVDILVSTTVIEVGIDVPNASVILIENAERFGMSQLHQLRGRVGRGKWQSYCIFLYRPKDSEDGKPKRLDILEHSNDGFKIAEEDLKMRGPGDLFGVRQSGDLGFVLADIYDDANVMQMAASYVDEVLTKDPNYSPRHMRMLDFRTI